jgi:hypothetical protein
MAVVGSMVTIPSAFQFGRWELEGIAARTRGRMTKAFYYDAMRAVVKDRNRAFERCSGLFAPLHDGHGSAQLLESEVLSVSSVRAGDLTLLQAG